jgi:hypothetical protein
MNHYELTTIARLLDEALSREAETGRRPGRAARPRAPRSRRRLLGRVRRDPA